MREQARSGAKRSWMGPSRRTAVAAGEMVVPWVWEVKRTGGGRCARRRANTGYWDCSAVDGNGRDEEEDIVGRDDDEGELTA